MGDPGAVDVASRAAAPAGYRRSTGSPRGEARREQLLALVTEDVSAHGLVDFSLRRAARAAGTTHKVLLYHFDGPDELLAQVVLRLRERRIDAALAAAAASAGCRTLADRVRAIWPVLSGPDFRVLEQAVGLAMYDPASHGSLARELTQQYLPPLVSICPPDWSPGRKSEVAAMILAVLRGFLVDWRTADAEPVGVEAGFAALARALDREEAAQEQAAVTA